MSYRVVKTPAAFKSTYETFMKCTYTHTHIQYVDGSSRDGGVSLPLHPQVSVKGRVIPAPFPINRNRSSQHFTVALPFHYAEEHNAALSF